MARSNNFQFYSVLFFLRLWAHMFDKFTKRSCWYHFHFTVFTLSIRSLQFLTILFLNLNNLLPDVMFKNC